MDINEKNYLVGKATDIRALALKMFKEIGKGHVGGAMSISDVLAVLYFKRLNIRPEEPRWASRDRVVLSKGHAGPALYAALALRGFFPVEECLTLNKPGTNLPSHCDMNRTIRVCRLVPEEGFLGRCPRSGHLCHHSRCDVLRQVGRAE
ncbi:MAG: hypothetical protein IIX84_03335, partial [Oscillospiraceae bacterium]|nr:hypothetical protein [Oscillospiraceae bacterium]